jgi:hypothetical protein
VGALSDSRREHYQVSLPAKALGSSASEHLITVRVYDRHDNVSLAKTVFTVPPQLQAPPDSAPAGKAD